MIECHIFIVVTRVSVKINYRIRIKNNVDQIEMQKSVKFAVNYFREFIFITRLYISIKIHILNKYT